MLKIVIIAIAAMFLAMVAGCQKKEYSFFIVLCTALLIFSFGISRIQVIADRLHEFEQEVNLSGEYISILLKMVGIAYLSQFAVSLCKDAGQGAIAGQVSFAGKISMLLISLPILEGLVKTIGEILS
ncbi:MAG: stage III sporulation protein AD [Eubacterium sp.]|nr:stage III sporulation protein AD [Eubacterium sp.]